MGFAHEPNVVEHHASAAPRLVPMEADAPDVLRSLWISENRADALVDEIAVVVPGDDLPVGESFSSHRGPEKALEEVALFLGRVDARFPRLRSHGLVLYRDSPDRDPFPLVRLDELRVIVRPCLSELRLQLSAVQHVAVGLHECRWAPRAREDRQLPSRRRERLLGEWN